MLAVGTAGAIAGTGIAVQSAVADSYQRVAATAEFSAATGRQHEQLAAYSTVLEMRADGAARASLSTANTVIASAAGKVDATALSASVADLGEYERLAPERVFALVADVNAQVPPVQAAVAEVDRIAAEAAAAAQAAAEQAAREAAEAEEAKAPSSGSRPSAPSNPSEAQAIARDLMAQMYGWGDDQFGCLVPLWAAESGWNVNSYNSSSGAGGIPQALPASKMASAGADWQTNPATQIRWGLGYIAGRYGTPCGAWDNFNAKGWY